VDMIHQKEMMVEELLQVHLLQVVVEVVELEVQAVVLVVLLQIQQAVQVELV